MVRNLSKTDLMSKAPTLFKGYDFQVKEAAQDQFESMLAELQCSLVEGNSWPVMIVVHCRAYYIENHKYVCDTITDIVVEQMSQAQSVIHDEQAKQGSQYFSRLIWSRIVAEPINSEIFSKNTLFNSLKTVNSDAAAQLYSKRIGIIKHSQIEPNAKWFQTDGMPTVIAKLQFIQDMESYMREFEAFEEYKASGLKPEKLPKLKDISEEIKFKQMEEEKKVMQQ